MSDWAAGYVLDIPYTSGFYRELAPASLQFALLGQATHSPDLGIGSTYCELACGQGFGTALLAAANPQTRFWGFDFNPAQIANARRLASEAGLGNVIFEDFSFEQAVALPDIALPQFDVIAVHGVYSWVSPENRQFIVEFLNRRLKPGGLVYLSYNCMPGWAAAAPLQRLMREHAQRHPDRSDQQAASALKFAETLKQGGAAYFNQNPSLAGRMEKMPALDASYLAHEYLNGHWHPLFFLDVAREMEPARLNFVASATIAENVDAIAFPGTLQPMISQIRDRGWKETLQDFAANKQFRRDIFVRGASAMTAPELRQVLAEQRFALLVPMRSITLKFAGLLGDVIGKPEIYMPIVEALGKRVHSAAELSRLPALTNLPATELLLALSMLVHSGQVHPAPNDLRTKSGDVARAFNKIVSQRIRKGQILNFLAAPVVGTGIPASYAELVGLLALSENPKISAQEAAQLGWSIMLQTGQRLLKDGKTLQTQEEIVPELEAQLSSFLNEKLPTWRILGVL